MVAQQSATLLDAVVDPVGRGRVLGRQIGPEIKQILTRGA